MERYNLVVIGAGSGGLVVAAGGAALGAHAMSPLGNDPDAVQFFRFLGPPR